MASSWLCWAQPWRRPESYFTLISRSLFKTTLVTGPFYVLRKVSIRRHCTGERENFEGSRIQNDSRVFQKFFMLLLANSRATLNELFNVFPKLVSTSQFLSSIAPFFVSVTLTASKNSKFGRVLWQWRKIFIIHFKSFFAGKKLTFSLTTDEDTQCLSCVFTLT